MDEIKRKKAQTQIDLARHLDHRHASEMEIINAYHRALDLLLQIEDKQIDDFRQLASVCSNLAIIHFNRKEYSEASTCYINSINYLLQTEENDSTFRKIAGLYIDLADACLELCDIAAGNDAALNAIKAFNLIKIKTSQEKALGDPAANFKAFHAHFEEQSSTKSYVKSTRFLNHEQLLVETQVEKHQESLLFSQFEGISLNEIKQIDASIESMLDQLSITEKQHFHPVAINQAPEDSAYRNMAMQLLRLAQSQIKNNLISATIDTYHQVISTLNAIRVPQESELLTLKHLREQIHYLKSKPQPTAPQSKPSSHNPASMAPVLGIFAPRQNPDAKPLGADESMEVDEAYAYK